jgi:hypothetical protein
MGGSTWHWNWKTEDPGQNAGLAYRDRKAGQHRTSAFEDPGITFTDRISRIDGNHLLKNEAAGLS